MRNWGREEGILYGEGKEAGSLTQRRFAKESLSEKGGP